MEPVSVCQHILLIWAAQEATAKELYHQLRSFSRHLRCNSRWWNQRAINNSAITFCVHTKLLWGPWTDFIWKSYVACHEKCLSPKATKIFLFPSKLFGQFEVVVGDVLWDFLHVWNNHNKSHTRTDSSMYQTKVACFRTFHSSSTQSSVKWKYMYIAPLDLQRWLT